MQSMKMYIVACLGAAMASSAACGLTMRLADGGAVEVHDGQERIARYSGLLLSYGKLWHFTRGRGVAGDGAIEVEYLPPDGFPDKLARPVAKGLFACTGGVLSVRFTVSGVSTNDHFGSGLCMFERRHARGLARSGLSRPEGYWVRDPNGGQPWEELLPSVLAYTNSAGRGVKYLFGKRFRPNPGWASDWAQHLVFRKNADGEWESSFSVAVADPARSDVAIALSAAARPAQVTLSTGRTYNWFEDASGELSFEGRVMNAQGTRRTFDISWWVRGFNGETFSKGTRRADIAAGATETVPVAFDPKEPRGLYFVEMSATDTADGREAFARTSIARLPPHRFKATPDNSVFGIAAYWPIPDEESVQRLMDRMGVMWVRSGDTRKQHPPRVAKHSSSVEWPSRRFPEGKLPKGEAREKWIVSQLETCRTNRCEYWEFANEINAALPGIGLKGTGLGRGLLAPLYAEFVKDIVRVKKAHGYDDIKLLSVGLGGYDAVFLRKVKECGAWDCFDGICLHPGRGNFTVDYPYLVPERTDAGAAMEIDDPQTAEQLAHSSYWNYLASVRGAQRQMREYGDKPLWLTEVYTPLHPNNWWEDTLHCAAENVVMMYAFIKADGVKCGMFYQMFDSVWYDKLGIDPNEREYSFGLLRRDLSFKPTLMAYCAIAEALDEAEFAGWMKATNKTTHAMLFKTPRGPMAVIWDRTEGMILNRDHKDGKPFPSPEPWETYWKHELAYELPAKGNVHVVNPIGQRREVPSVDGKVKLMLTGAPIIVYGVDLDRVPRVSRYTNQWSAALNAEIDGRIEKFRKADGEFAIPGLAVGAEVFVEQIESDFKFGCNIFNFDQFGDERKNAEYRAAFLPGGLFNAATVPFYWNALEPEKGRPRYAKDAASAPEYWKAHGKDDPAWRRPAPDAVLDFLDANGISAHGHAIIYCRFHPKWACDKAMDGEARWRLYADHIAEIGARYGSRIPQWDVVNESIDVYSPPDAPREISSCDGAALPEDCTMRSFRAAAEAFPGGVRKCINGVFVGANWPAFISSLVRRSAPVDAIGHQMHIFNEVDVVKVAAGEEARPNMLSWDVASQTAMMKKYDEIGLPVHVSEITIPAPVSKMPRDEAEALQARLLRDNYRLWFSWPSVYRITYWNLVDGMGQEILESGLLRNDLSKKPAYHALWRLVNEEWRTRTRVAAVAGGKVRFRGFKGRYRLGWKDADGQRRFVEVSLK